MHLYLYKCIYLFILHITCIYYICMRKEWTFCNRLTLGSIGSPCHGWVQCLTAHLFCTMLFFIYTHIYNIYILNKWLARGPYRRKISSAALPNLLPVGCPQHFSQVWLSAGSGFQLVQWDILAMLETGKSMDINGLIQIPTIQRWESNPRKSKILPFWSCVFAQKWISTVAKGLLPHTCCICTGSPSWTAAAAAGLAGAPWELPRWRL